MHTRGAVEGRLEAKCVGDIVTPHRRNAARQNIQLPRTKPSEALLMLTYLIDILLITIALLELSRFRSSHHNTYEVTHRLLGWTALALVWLHTVYLI